MTIPKGWELFKGAEHDADTAALLDVIVDAARRADTRTMDAVASSLTKAGALASLTHAQTVAVRDLVGAVIKGEADPDALDRLRSLYVLLGGVIDELDETDEENGMSDDDDAGVTAAVRAYRKASADANPLVELDTLAKALAASENLSFEAAYAKVIDTELGREYYEQADGMPGATKDFIAKSIPARPAPARTVDTPELDRLSRLAKARAGDQHESFEVAYAKILDTPEGRDLYAAYLKRERGE